MKRRLYDEVLQSGYIHTPLPLHLEDEFERDLAGKEVLRQKSIYKGEEKCDAVWSDGRGFVSIVPGAARNGGNAILLSETERPENDDTRFMQVCAHFSFDHEDWRAYNRISCYIKPICEGQDYPKLNIGLFNDGAHPIPDKYWREGIHMNELVNGEWNHVIWEFEDLYRDQITEMILNRFVHFEDDFDRAILSKVAYYIDEITLEYVAYPEQVHGWVAKYPVINYCTMGYLPSYSKTAICANLSGTFSILDSADHTVYTGKIVEIENERGKFGVLDFSAVQKEDNYRIQVGDYLTKPFPISKDVLEDTFWITLNGIFLHRCGYPIPGVRDGCHFDFFAKHEGKTHVYVGAWHDQFSIQSNELLQSLLESADSMEQGSILRERYFEEAYWGLDFAFRCRYGDGYRGTCAGSAATGEADDSDVRIHNHPIDNATSASTFGLAAKVLKDRDPRISKRALLAAKEDFGFALAEYEKNGFTTPPIRYEHTYGTAVSLFYAIMSTAASRIYQGCKEVYYARQAEYFMDLLLACQETDATICPITGFFYRDKQKKTTVHFNHQAREHLFVESILEIVKTQPDHPKTEKWENALRLYAQYLKDIAAYTAPYGMIPAGIYTIDEAYDPELCELMHPGMHPYVRYEEEKENILAQIQNGSKLNDRFYLRVYPVWFSFRGGSLVHLESGKAATLLGKYFADDALMQLGLEQLYWLFGKNPFLQSVMYGAGHRYGPIGMRGVGYMPLGIQSRENEDTPYYPQANNGTYREVWSVPSKGVLSIAADLFE